MGGKYSKVVNPHYPALKVLEGLSLPELKGKLSGMAKAKHKAGVYFLTKSDISWAFEQLMDLQLYYIVSLFDLSRNGNIPSLDFWGALALLSAASNDEKINFCFKMMDLNNDEYLSYSDLVIVMNCATRGVAKFRGYMVMPYEYLDRMAMEAFRVCKKSLSPEGEISMLDFRAVLLSDDLVGQYMSNLGVPVVEVDAAALVTKRSNLLREAMALRAKIADTLCALEECEEQAVQKAGERGGDIELLRVSAQELEHNRVQQALAVAAELRRKLRDKGLLVDGAGAEQGAVVPFALPTGQNPAPQRSREGRRPPNKLELTDPQAHDGQAAAHSVSSVVASDPMHPSRRYLKCDNSVFADADMSADKQSATGMYGEGFRSALLEVWLKLPQDQDLMAELDAYTVVALFDNVTVTLPYEAAQHCLQHLPRSAIGRYCFDDVLHWYLLHGAGLATKEAKGPPPAARSNAGAGGGAVVAVVKDGSHWQPVSAALQTVVAGGALSGHAWQAFTDSCMSMYTSCGATLGDTVSKAAYLRSVLDRVDQLPPHRVLKYPNHRHPDRAAAAATPSSGARSGGGPSGGAREMGYMMKLVEFRKLTSKKPSTVQLKYVFNKPNVKLLPKPAASSQQPGEFGSRGGSSRERGRPAGKATGTARANSRSRSRGKSPAAPHRRPGSRDGDGEGPGAVAPTTGGGAEPRPTSSGHDRYTSEAERLPPTKTIKVEEIDDWKLTFKLAFTASPFTNLATKRSKDSSRVRSANGRDFIEDFPNLQAQDLLDYFNLRQEREAEEQLLRDQAAAVAAAAAVTTAAAAAAAEGEASEVAALLGGPQPQPLPRPAVSVHQPVKKKDPVVYSSVSWVCLELRSSLQPEQVELFAAALHNFFTGEL
jgi:Ca2+-binding EF-hand superfamily protein